MGKEPERSGVHRQLSAAVLVGGESKRMGVDKALVDFDGVPLVVHVISHLETFAEDVFVVGKDVKRFEALRLRAVAEPTDERSPLIGVAAALHGAEHGSVFVCGCDMPFVDARLVAVLAARAQGMDAAVPMRDGILEPLHAVWSVAAATKIDPMIAEGERTVFRALDSLHISVVEESEWRAVDPGARSFTNINTPADLKSALASD